MKESFFGSLTSFSKLEILRKKGNQEKSLVSTDVARRNAKHCQQ